jgi:hypothetical protein
LVVIAILPVSSFASGNYFIEVWRIAYDAGAQRTTNRMTFMKLKVFLRVVGLSQIALGIAYLFFPLEFLRWMGHTLPAPDMNYPLGMLAARFLAYGVGMFAIARSPARHVFWIDNMALIQLVDLAVGIAYTSSGSVSLRLSAFPMFNAALIASLLWLWRPKSASALHAAA